MPIEVAIVGVGETPPCRRATSDVRTLVLEALHAALDDAGIAPNEVQGFVSETGVMPTTVPVEFVSASFGVERRFSGGASYGGAGICYSPMLAHAAIESGQADVVVCYFGVDWGSAPNGPYGFHDAYPAKLAFEKPYGFMSQPSYFALWAQRYVARHPESVDAFAELAVLHSQNARLTGRAQLSRETTRESYFASRMVSDPLRTRDCCLISDGAGAFVMTSKQRARDCRKKPVHVLGSALAAPPITGDDVFTQSGDLSVLPGVSSATEAALAMAGISRADLNFAQIYDCFTISCILQLEGMGFCDVGGGARFVLDGNVARTGDLPINTHGGMLAYSYRLGIEHVVEAVRQLRGEAGRGQLPDPKLGIVTGLSMPDFGVMVLGV
jgi:acetyl-CoA acetyltransferase